MQHRLAILIVVAVMSSAVSASAQRPLKVYISVDMEGIAGVVGDDQTSAGQPEYNRSRKLMAEVIEDKRNFGIFPINGEPVKV